MAFSRIIFMWDTLILQGQYLLQLYWCNAQSFSVTCFRTQYADSQKYKLSLDLHQQS